MLQFHLFHEVLQLELCLISYSLFYILLIHLAMIFFIFSLHIFIAERMMQEALNWNMYVPQLHEEQ